MYSPAAIPVCAEQAQYQVKGQSNTANDQKKLRKRFDHGKSFMWINSQIIASSQQGSSIDDIVYTISQHLHNMNLVNLTTAIHRLGKTVAHDAKAQMRLKQLPIFPALLEPIAVLLSTTNTKNLQPQSLSNILWALASIRYVDNQVISLVCAHALPNVDRFKPFELTTLLWALAKVSTIESSSRLDMVQVSTVFDAAGKYILHHARSMDSRCLSMVVWAYATAKQANAELFDVVAALMVNGPMPSCQEMANTIWAYGTQNINHRELFKAMACKGAANLAEFKAQELSNMLWGFASAGFFHEHFFQQAAASALSKDLSAQHVANILWAFARVNPRHPLAQQTVLNFVPLCLRQLRNFKPQEVCSVALSIAKVFVGPDFVPPLPPLVLDFFHCVSRMRHNLEVYSTQSLTNLASAFAMVQLFDDSLLFKLGHEAVARAPFMDAPDLLRIFQVFLSVQNSGMDCANIAGLLVAPLASRVKSLRPRDIKALSLSCSDFLHDSNRQDLLEECAHVDTRFGADSKFEVASVAETDEPIHSLSEMSDNSADEAYSDIEASQNFQYMAPQTSLCQDSGLSSIVTQISLAQTEASCNPLNVGSDCPNSTPPPSSLLWEVDGQAPDSASRVVIKNTFIECQNAKPQGVSAVQFCSEKIRRRRPSKEDASTRGIKALSLQGRCCVAEDAYETDDGF
jgi:hypothetical protein|mmetsp:Transcript_39463/g.62619  ORF Transcript_39463/g.62619 Transcript_39463/m.62619 type:complete len:685 (+) Transcript_39463:87-2141(+)